MPKALALYSGGLDSTLAILAVLRLGIEVTAVTFLTKIGCGVGSGSEGQRRLVAAAEKLGFEVRLADLSEKFLDIVRNPRFGYGRNMNPCIDCKIAMLKEAGEMMVSDRADFIVTGEVLWQRPMSQRRDTLQKIDREAGLGGYILRPLSAKLLKPTVPELEGVVERERLYGFHGRSRKPQMALAQELGLADYPQPAGGCLLTDPIYSFRLKELLAHVPEPSTADLALLKVGRHFRMSDDSKAVVGRDERENNTISEVCGHHDVLLNVETYGSPVTIIRGHDSDEILTLAASLCARYSDAKRSPLVDVTITRGGETSVLQVAPASEEVIERCRIQPR